MLVIAIYEIIIATVENMESKYYKLTGNVEEKKKVWNFSSHRTEHQPEEVFNAPTLPSPAVPSLGLFHTHYILVS